MKDEYCYNHGGWGSTEKPCKMCGHINPPNTMPEIPKGLSWIQAIAWGAREINDQIRESIK